MTEEEKIEQELRENADLLSLAAGRDVGWLRHVRPCRLYANLQQHAICLIFPLSGEVRVPERISRDILKKVVDRTSGGIFARGCHRWRVHRASAALFFDKDEHIELHDGRWLSLRTRVADNGMALVAVSDITTMKQAEFALRTVAEQMKSLAGQTP